MIRFSRYLVLGSYFGLLILLLLWAVWLAPHPHFPISLVVIVQLGPLLLPLRGLLYGRVYTHALTCFLALYYFVLGVDDVAAAVVWPWLAWCEVILSLGLFAGCVAYTRLRTRQLRALADSNTG